MSDKNNRFWPVMTSLKALLTTGDFGSTVAKGLAELAKQRPEHPVEYLARWLLNTQRTVEQIGQSRQLAAAMKTGAPETTVPRRTEEGAKAEGREAVLADFSAEDLGAWFDFRGFLKERFCDLMALQSGFPNCAAAEFELQERKAEEGTFDPELHFDASAAKQLKFVAANRSQRELVAGRVVPEGKGAVRRLLGPQSEPSEVPAEWQVRGGESRKWPEAIYIENVVLEPQMHFFGIPRFGSFLGVKLEISSTFQAEFVDDFINAFLKRPLERQKPGEAEGEGEGEGEGSGRRPRDWLLESLEQSLAESDEFQAVAVEMAAELSAARNSLPSAKKTFVLCFDNLGQEERFPVAEERLGTLLGRLAELKQRWEETEFLGLAREALFVHTALNDPATRRSFEQLLRELPVCKSAPGSPDFFEKALQTSEQRVEAVLSFVESAGLREGLAQLSRLSRPRHPQVLQNAFSFLNFEKTAYDLPATNKLNWEAVRTTLLSQETVDALLSFDWRAEQRVPRERFNRLNVLRERIAKIDGPAVEASNLTLFVLHCLIRELVDLRLNWVVNCEFERGRLVRRIESLKAENCALLDRQAEELREARAAFEAQLREEETEALFDEGGWLAEWRERNECQLVPELPAAPFAEDVDESFIRGAVGAEESEG